MTESVRFYRDVLGMELLYGGEKGVLSAMAWLQQLRCTHVAPASDKNPAGKVEFGFTGIGLVHQQRIFCPGLSRRQCDLFHPRCIVLLEGNRVEILGVVRVYSLRSRACLYVAFASSRRLRSDL